MADSAKTAATLRGRRYIAADLQVDASNTFMTGLLGFAEEESLRQFEPEAFSWLKGDVRDIDEPVRRTPNREGTL